MEEAFSPLNLFFAPVATGYSLQEHFSKEVSGMSSTPLPPQISLVTLTKVYTEPGAYFIRLAHQYGVGEDAVFSQPASVDLKTLLPSNLKFKSFVEMSLTGNQERKTMEANRLKWIGDGEVGHTKTGRDSDKGSVVTLNPLEIRSFKILTRSEKI
jgi:hypothetical protein